jgi:hypothetical protein
MLRATPWNSVRSNEINARWGISINMVYVYYSGHSEIGVTL